jgi:hypothetical protein
VDATLGYGGHAEAILAKSRARAWFHADRLPNDVHAALHAPAKLARHEGSIVVTDDKGLHVLETQPHPLGQAPSMEAMLAGEPMLGFATSPEQRLREASRFAKGTVPRYDANLLLIEGITQDAPRAALGLRDHIKAKLGYESPPPDALAAARHVIDRIETVVSHSATGYEGTGLLMHLAATREHLGKLLHAAERYGVPFLGTIPLHEQVAPSGDAGAPIVHSRPESPIAERLREISRRVMSGA